MSQPCDDPDEMTRHQQAAERVAEDILRGRVAALEGEDRALAETMAALRITAASVPPPHPSEQLLAVFSEGVPAQDREPAGSVGTTGGTPARRRTALRPRLARLAGLSLAAKIALAGTATAAASIGGAGAIGMLPGQGDGLPPTEPADEAEADSGPDVADEATGTDDGTDRPDVSEETRLLRERGARADAEARAAERREEAQERREEAQARRDEARQQREEPGQRAPGDAGGRADEAPGTGPSTGPRSGAEGRDHAAERNSGTSGQTPSERAPTQDRADQAPAPDGSVPGRIEAPEREQDAPNGAESDERPGAESEARSGTRPETTDREVGETPLPGQGAGRR